MDLRYPKEKIPNPLSLLRKAGYAPFQDPQSGERSFVIRLTPDYYPRLHLYVKETRDQIILSVHLDQKKPSYGQTHAHNADYDGPLIEKELRRLDRWVQAEQLL